MKFGLTDLEYKYIFETVVDPLKNLGVEVFCFGSRAAGSQQKFSDLDLMLKVANKTDEVMNAISSINESLEQGNFPYKVDIVFEKDVAKSYKDNIADQMVLF